MPQYHIHILESRIDWPVIVTSVECPTCQAGKGKFCKQVATPLGGLGQQSQRSDFHAARKYAAAKFLEENPMPSTQVSSTSVISPDPFKEILEGRVPEHIKEMRTPPEKGKRKSRTRKVEETTPTSE